MKKAGKRNQGFTLIELLVGVAILSVVSLMAFGIFMAALNFYQSGASESSLQNEAQLTMTQLENLVVNANQGVGLAPGTPETTTTGSDLYIYNRNVDETSKAASYQVTHIYQGEDTDDDKLYYCYMTYSYDSGTDSYVLSADKQDPKLLSNYIKDFGVDVSKLKEKNSISFSIAFEHRSKNYESTNTVLLRNKMPDNTGGSADDYFQVSLEEDRKNDITTVTISPTSWDIWEGTSITNPFKATFTNASGLTYEGGQAIWTVEPEQDKVTVNRSTGTIQVENDVTADSFTMRATALSSINLGGNNSTLYKSADATVKIKKINNATLTQPVADASNPKILRATYTLSGSNLTKEDLSAVTPVVSATGISVEVAANEAASSGSLVYDVTIHRPGNYSGKTYNINIKTTTPGGKQVEASTTVSFTATTSDGEHTITGVNIKEKNGTGNAQGGIATFYADRGGFVSLVCEVTYDDGSTVTLNPQSWGITQTGDGGGASITTGSDGYTIAFDSENYGEDMVLHFSTYYYDDLGNEHAGPQIDYNFSKVILKVAGSFGNQTTYPVTKGQTQWLCFVADGVEDAKIYVESGNSPNISVTAIGMNASVFTKATAGSIVDYTFGLKDKDGNVISGISCSVSLWPDKANTVTLNGASTSDSMYLPLVTDITIFDATQTAPEEGRMSKIYASDGNAITYVNLEKKAENGKTYQYWATYKEKEYFYNRGDKMWHLNEK